MHANKMNLGSRLWTCSGHLINKSYHHNIEFCTINTSKMSVRPTYTGIFDSRETIRVELVQIFGISRIHTINSD